MGDIPKVTEYEQVTLQFRALTDIRFKLLGFLPLGTLAGVALFKEQLAGNFALPIGVFGFVTTIAIYVYNLRNDQHYDELISRAAELERELCLHEGSFSCRPASWHEVAFGLTVEHRWPIALIYQSSAGLWLWLASTAERGLGLGAGAGLTVAVLFVLLASLIERWSQNASKHRYKKAVQIAMPTLIDAPLGDQPASFVAVVASALVRELGGGADRTKKFEKRLRFYLDPQNANLYFGESKSPMDVRTASQVLGHTIDMPPRWIRDIYSGRRG